MFRLHALFRRFDLFRTPSVGEYVPPDPGTETYYILAGGVRILAGTDLITVGAP